MKAALFHQHGNIDVLTYEDIDTPQPGPGEVLIEVKACSLNHLDLWVRQGLPGLKLPLPHIGGSDIAGVVSEVGKGVAQVAVGQRVVIDPGLSCGICRWCEAGEDSLCDHYGILGEHRWGGFAQYAVVPARNVLPLPDHVSFEQAAAAPLVFLTAWRMLRRAKVRPGHTVLVIGAGGGVASAAIQIAKLSGATVYATAGTPKKLAQAQTLGAAEVINHREHDFSKPVWALTDRRGVDVVIDPVGGTDTLPKAMRALTKDGRYVTCGATSGPTAKVDVRLLFWKQVRLLGSTMGSRKELREVLALVWNGKLNPIVDRTLPLSEMRTAHKLIESRQVFGKLVIVP